MNLQAKGAYASAIIWGTWVLVLTGVDLPGYWVTAITSLTGFLALFVYILLIKGTASFRDVLHQPRLLKLILLVAFLEAANNALFMAAMLVAIAGEGSIFVPLIRALTGITTPLLVSILARHEFSVKYLLYGIMATLGIIVLFTWDGLDLSDRLSPLGILLASASVIMWSAQLIIQRFLALETTKQNQTSTNVITYQSLFAGVFLLPLVIYYAGTSDGFSLGAVWPQILFIGIFGITHVAVAFILQLNALKHITAQQAAVINYLEPLTSITLSILVLHETFNIGFIIGATLILTAAVQSGRTSTEKL